MDDFAYALDRLRKAAAGLPAVEEGTSYGTPALKVRGKLLCRVKDADTVVLVCPLEEKELLMMAAPDVYYETAHYRGWAAVLVRIRVIADAELAHRLALAWRRQAPRRLVMAADEGGEAPPRRAHAAGAGPARNAKR